MVFAALDDFEAERPIPEEGAGFELPAYDSALARLIWRRQIASVLSGFGTNMWRFVLWTFRRTSGATGTGELSQRQIEPLLEALGAGRPVPIGLVAAAELKRIGGNHQVLAYGADVIGDRMDVRIYDPNYPKRDDVVLGIPLRADGDIIEIVGKKRIVWRGFFVEHYASSRRPTENGSVERSHSDTAALLLIGAVGTLMLLGLSRFSVSRRHIV